VCLSPEVDLAVGTVVVAIGVDALRHVREPKQIPLAAIPLLLGLHQITEAFIWWGLQGQVGHALERVALWLYLLFAMVALPALMTIAVLLIERSPVRRYAIGAFVVLALGVASALVVAIFRGSIGAAIDGRHIAYHIEALDRGGAWTALYVIATCGALLVSSYRDMEILGALNLLAIPALMWLTLSGLVSLWCFWAAIVSVVIAFHLRRQSASAVPAPSGTREGRTAHPV
jgi:hypothetical protein